MFYFVVQWFIRSGIKKTVGSSQTGYSRCTRLPPRLLLVGGKEISEMRKPSLGAAAADPEEVPMLESFAGGAIVGGGFPSLAAPLL
jgi:hypothetical protein